MLDRTHDPKAVSWLESANVDGADFPIQNLPFGRARHAAWGDAARVVVAIGDKVLDVVATARSLGFRGAAAEAAEACAAGALNPLVASSPAHAKALRHALFDALSASSPSGSRAPEGALALITQVDLLMPVEIGDYTDFFCSMHHAVNASRIFRRPQPLQPNYHHLPVGYHGRASSVVVSGTPIRRPAGQLPPAAAGGAPAYAPSRMLDYEVELGIIARGGNRLGETIDISDAEDAIFGVCVQNDWSARDIQRWENLPLGPFLSKSFATSISPWIVTVDALRPFTVAQPARPDGAPVPPPHLLPADHTTWAIEIDCAIEANGGRHQISRSRVMDLHWSPKQMVAHHASNGCNLRAGDLLGSGTISGSLPESWGCLLERTLDGSEPLVLGNARRGYLEDGDCVMMTGRCQAQGARPIGLGSCEGTIVPSVR